MPHIANTPSPAPFHRVSIETAIRHAFGLGAPIATAIENAIAAEMLKRAGEEGHQTKLLVNPNVTFDDGHGSTTSARSLLLAMQQAGRPATIPELSAMLGVSYDAGKRAMASLVADKLAIRTEGVGRGHFWKLTNDGKTNA